MIQPLGISLHQYEVTMLEGNCCVPSLLLDVGPFRPVSSKAMQAPKVRVMSVAGLAGWLAFLGLAGWLASTLTWTMAFRDCQLWESLGSYVGLSHVFTIFPLTTSSTAQ